MATLQPIRGPSMSESIKSAASEPVQHPIRPKLGVREAANYLGVSASMLNKLRVTGGGPVYYKLNRRCVYDLRDLDEWAASRKRRHTSEDSSEPAQAPRLADFVLAS